MQSLERPASEIARQSGICRIQLYKWKGQLALTGDQAFTGRGRRPRGDAFEYKRELRDGLALPGIYHPT